MKKDKKNWGQEEKMKNEEDQVQEKQENEQEGKR